MRPACFCRLAALHDDADYRKRRGDRCRMPTIAATPPAILAAQSTRRARRATAAHAAALRPRAFGPSEIESSQSSCPSIAPARFPRSRTSPRGCGSTRSARRPKPAADIRPAAVDGRHHGGAVLRRDAVRPEGSAQPRERSLRAVEGARRADSLRGVGRGRRVRSRRAAEAARARLRSRRPSDAAAAVRRRRDRLARPGHLRRDRHRAQRPPHRVATTAPTCCSATANRPKARSGKRPTSPRWISLDNLCGITDVNGLGQSRATMWEHDMAQFERRWTRVRLARHRHRRPRHERDSRRARRSARAPRASRR